MNIGDSRRSVAGLAGWLLLPGTVFAQGTDELRPAIDATAGTVSSTDGDIVVTGRRLTGSVLSEVQPIAVLNESAIRSLGATSLTALSERLSPLTTSTDGSEPIYLLNGSRVSSFSELESLPPEAIERIEVLPESEAAKFGFPPTVRVSNFITKRHFRALMAQELAGTTTEGGGGTNFAEFNSTRIDGPRRLSISASHFRQGAVRQSQRSIVPDPDALYAIGGTVTGLDGGSIDAGLNALAGRPVTVAAIPGDVDRRLVLGSYLAGAGAGTTAVTDIGAYRTLQQRADTVNLSTTLASPIGRTVNGSLNLALEAQRSSGLNGLAPVTLRVPGGSKALPFADDVLVYRYLPDVVLSQRSDALNLHAGGTLQGGIRRWAWNVTSGYDRLRSRTHSDQSVNVDDFQAAVDVGGDPLAPIDTTGLVRTIVDRSDTVTGTLVTKAVANGPLLRLPAGDAQVTVSAEHTRSTSTGTQTSGDDDRFDFARTIKTASVGANLPIASADVLPVLGRLSLNGTIGVSDVSDYGRLTTSSYGATWTPSRLVQFTATISDALTPPDIALLTSPVTTTPNTPYFDFVTGTSGFVTTLTGGRADLKPERRRRSQFGIALTPIRGKELRLSVDYIDTRLTNQIARLGSATAAFQNAFPGAFERDALGQLVRVDLRPVNLNNEHERRVRVAINLSTPIGRAPPPVPEAAPGSSTPESPPPPPPKQRPTVDAFVTTTLRLDDQLVLQPGTAPLDLLDGQTLTGTGGRPRWETQVDLRGTIGAFNLGLYGRMQGATRIRGDLARSDLTFSGRTWIVAYNSLDLEKIVDRPWAKNMSVQFTIENLLNDRVNVRDRNGATPNRFQPAYLDPLGRSVRLGVRKLF